MLAEPRATRRPHSPLRAVNRRRAAPEVRVVVGDPTPGSVVDSCRIPSRGLQLADHAQQGLVALAEITDLGHPIVHLDIDVDRVLASPGRIGLVVPNALQVQGLRTGSRPGDHQIAAILEELFGQTWITAALGDSLEPLVGREVLVHPLAAKINRHAAKQL